jgi:hypothetical protein
MTSTQMWIIGLVVAFLSGGAMGAIIKEIVHSHRNRRQPIAYDKDVIVIFNRLRNFPKLEAKLMVKEHPLGSGDYKEVDNLALAQISLTNKGNQDIEKYNFGVTMQESNKVIDVRMLEPDRHHQMTTSFHDLTTPISQLDFTLEPFNREDTYNVTVYFTYEKAAGPVKLSSPHPSKLVPKSNSTIEMAAGGFFEYLVRALIRAMK